MDSCELFLDIIRFPLAEFILYIFNSADIKLTPYRTINTQILPIRMTNETITLILVKKETTQEFF